ncbi:MAG: metallophosphoesterase [Candidatus Omnitrophica bacterium]|nr:metallophosphoesterase [Candidatus Omnitrophota bacterium]MBU4488903.1 metallophosphoesterase [Candidatus Omnitrophota bacterium]MCG2705492.1 metallophosphoesterase [Candidatus Omnitrophota bacterium]
MRIGVLSDTHIPRACPNIPAEILSAFKGADLILHAGDLVEMSVLRELEKLAKTKAVYGNMDGPELRKLLGEKEIIKVKGFSIGLVHGYGPPANLINYVKDEFSEKVDVIVFGHSHSPVNEIKDGILFFNPGSPTDKIFAKYKSYGMLTIADGIKGEIIKIK